MVIKTAIENKQQNERLKAVFHAADVNGDGKISMEEFSRVLRAVGNDWTKENLDMLFKEADVDKNGYLDIDEFVDWLLPQSVVVRTSLTDYVENFKEIFDQFDTDGSKTITQHELQEGLEQKLIDGLIPDKAMLYLREADVDGNHRISLGEFIAWAEKVVPKDEWIDNDLDRWAAA